MIKSPWRLTSEEIESRLKTNYKKGLDEKEARARLKQFGRNRFPTPKKISSLVLFIRQFTSYIVWILIIAALIAGWLQEWIDSFAILAIIFLNAIFGFIQEFKAERSIEALQKLVRKESKIIRNGIVKMISSEEIVPGDLLLLEAGDSVAADGRLVKISSLVTQEASLTGESQSIYKSDKIIDKDNLTLGDRSNMIFRGTQVVAGKGYAICTTTGLETEMGKIANLIIQDMGKQKTPLQERLDHLGKQLVIFCLGIVGIIFFLALFKGYSLVSALLTSLSLAVAAIPEGLPAVVTVTLAIGMRKMAKRQALIRHLSAVETLGCTTVICTDKTGTLTRNQMCVTDLIVNQSHIIVTGEGLSLKGEFLKENVEFDLQKDNEASLLLKISTLCNGASIDISQSVAKITGDPTEGALLVAFAKTGTDPNVFRDSYPIVEEFPFDSERKRMSVIITENQQPTLYVKGAPDILLERSDTLIYQGDVIKLDDEWKKKIQSNMHDLAKKGLRLLACAYRRIDSLSESGMNAENHLTFVGMIAMRDLPRKEAEAAINLCKNAGIWPVMVTGDHLLTATRVAEELGILTHSEQAIDGIAFNELSDDELSEKVESLQVYARVSAEHKIRIIKALQQKGHVVAMTGDGVNDAAAIKKADIGIAMGITGTDVTKATSDMVILDDNFATIVSAVEEGRAIFDNIVKFVSYLVSCNVAEILVIFFSMLFLFTDVLGNPILLLTPVQLLWINLVTDGFPAVSLTLDPLSKGAMNLPPRNKNDPILSTNWVMRLFGVSLIITALTLLNSYFTLKINPGAVQTVAFTTLVVLELVKPFVLRYHYGVRFFSNHWLFAAVGASLVLQLSVIYIPSLQFLFKTVTIHGQEWVQIGVSALLFTLLSIPLMLPKKR